MALWFIESIRLRETGDKAFPYPSLNPILQKRGFHFIHPVEVEWVYDIAIRAYREWWSEELSDRKKASKDPLGNTDYIWH